jgi:hypothetical protein
MLQSGMLTAGLSAVYIFPPLADRDWCRYLWERRMNS